MNTQTTQTHQTLHTCGNHEAGYRAVLVREETKHALQSLRASLPDRDLFQERRLATAALELVIEDAARDSEARQRLLRRTREIVIRDLGA